MLVEEREVFIVKLISLVPSREVEGQRFPAVTDREGLHRRPLLTLQVYLSCPCTLLKSWKKNLPSIFCDLRVLFIAPIFIWTYHFLCPYYLYLLNWALILEVSPKKAPKLVSFKNSQVSQGAQAFQTLERGFFTDWQIGLYENTSPSFSYYSRIGLKQFLMSICWQFGCYLGLISIKPLIAFLCFPSMQYHMVMKLTAHILGFVRTPAT